jgi:hypothetical protein
MGAKGKVTDKSSAKGAGTKGKGKDKEKETSGGGSAVQEKAGKVKGAQSINVRHILVCSPALGI